MTKITYTEETNLLLHDRMEGTDATVARVMFLLPNILLYPIFLAAFVYNCETQVTSLLKATAGPN